jgi:chromosome segregation protein
MSQRLEERELAVNAARAEQQELIEALNAASAELETLQLAVSDKDDEQARLVDLENQVAEALRTHENELLAHEQEQRQLREQLAEETDRRHTLQKEIDRLTALAEQGPSDAAGGDGELLSERDKLLAELAVRESEVDQLRNVIAEYVDQIRAAQSDDATGSDVAALRAELEMVREQAIRDVAQMREKLAAAETQQRRLQQADGREAISHEAMRQRIEGLESSLAERQRELGGAEKSRHELEDSLEDANRQLDELRRELDRARGEADDAVSSRREAESARKQLKEEIRRLQEDMEEAKITDLRDARLKATPSKRPIGIDSVAAPRRWLTGFLGAGVLLALLEALSIYSGRGELFTALLRLSGQ